MENARRRRTRGQLFGRDIEHNTLNDNIIDDDEERHNGQCVGSSGGWFDWLLNAAFIFTMHKSTRTGLIGLAVLICAVTVIVLLNIASIFPKAVHNECYVLNGTGTCYSKSTDSYYYFGTKTSYRIALEKSQVSDLPTEGCTPKVFYLFSRHATRYPDEDNIIEMLERLPILQAAILNSSYENKANLCDEDIERLRKWREKLRLENDNQISPTGKAEAESLGKRFKARFPSILNRTYSPDVFTFEYTSRIRSRTTGEYFAKGLFGKAANLIDFKGQANDDVLQFHKECSKLKKRCDDDSLDISEVMEFENSPAMKKVIKSVSKRLGLKVNSDDVEFMYKACVFGFALDTDDIWCAVFSTEELKVLEYADDIDDYYKDGYGNEINYQQACPVAKYVVDLFKSSGNITEDKVVLHFSHAGAVKKVYTMFGLNQDSEPLTAEGLCTSKDRKWRSSLMAPFNSNIALILFQCGAERKVAALLNEKPVVLDGCESEMCPLADFYAKYVPVGKNCDIKGLCCTCCIH